MSEIIDQRASSSPFSTEVLSRAQLEESLRRTREDLIAAFQEATRGQKALSDQLAEIEARLLGFLEAVPNLEQGGNGDRESLNTNGLQVAGDPILRSAGSPGLEVASAHRGISPSENEVVLKPEDSTVRPEPFSPLAQALVESRENPEIAPEGDDAASPRPDALPPDNASLPPSPPEVESAIPPLESEIAAPPAEVPEGPSPEPADKSAGALVRRDAVLQAVSAKTGFPREMLEEYLNTGTKLELTPPKLIEIFKQISTSVPGAPALDLSRLAEFTELSALVDHLTGRCAEAVPAGNDAQPEANPSPVSPFSAMKADAPVEDHESRPEQPAAIPPESPFTAVASAADAPPESDAGVASPVSPFHKMKAGVADPEAPPAEPASPFKSVGARLVSGSATGPASPFVPAFDKAKPEAASSNAAKPERPPAPVPVPELKLDVAVERHVIHGQVSNACGFGAAQLHAAGTIYIVPDDMRVAEALQELLKSEGHPCEISSAVPSEARGVIVLNGLSSARSSEEAVRNQVEAYKAACSMLEGLGDQSGLFVTVQDTGGDFGMSSGREEETWTGGLLGLSRNVAAAFPRIAVKALDVGREGRSAEALARRILKELTEGGPEVEIGLSPDGTRLTRALDQTELSLGGKPLEQDAVVVVHGVGQGILTLSLLEMAKRQSHRFVLLGSVSYQKAEDDPFQAETDPDEILSGLTEMAASKGEAASPELLEQRLQTVLAQHEIRRLMTELRELGSNVCYFAVDASDAEALGITLSQVRGEWGEVDAILHCDAGPSRRENGAVVFGPAEESSFAQELASHSSGIEVLLELTKDDPLQLIGLLSASCPIGAAEDRAGYTVAHETVERLAISEAQRRGPKCIFRSIYWTLCDDRTLGTKAKKALEEKGIDLIPSGQAGRLIVNELNSDSGDLQVVLGPRRNGGQTAWSPSRLNTVTVMHVGRTTTPQLEDHVVQETTAVPAVMVMEWFMRFGRQVSRPGSLIRCRNFQQIQGIAVPDFEQSRVPFTMSMEALEAFQGNGSTAIELADVEGQRRYSAILEKAENEQALGLGPAPELELERTAWTGNHVYGPGALFHGPAFQVIHRVEGVSSHGALGRLVPPDEMGWSERPYVFHPAMIDGVTQLAFVWGLFTQDGEFFISSVGEYVQAPQANFDQALRCVLEGLDSSPQALKLNAYLESDGGDPVAVMRDVVCHSVQPSGA